MPNFQHYFLLKRKINIKKERNFKKKVISINDEDKRDVIRSSTCLHTPDLYFVI